MVRVEREALEAERSALEANVRRMKVRHGMDKESLEILEMVKEGRVTPEQGRQLLEALKMLEKAEFTKDGEHIKFGDYMKDLGGMDVATILQMVKEGAEGKLVDVDIEGNDGEHVKVEVIVD